MSKKTIKKPHSKRTEKKHLSTSQQTKSEIEAIPVVNGGLSGTDLPLSPEPVIEEVEESVQEETPQREQPRVERREIVRSASLVMLGNLSSSIMGMVRQIVVANKGSIVSASFFSALLPAQTFFDFMINGSVQGALIPTFTDYTTDEKRQELRRLVFTLVNLVLLLMGAASLLFFFVAPWFFDTLLGYGAGSKLLTQQFARIMFFSLILLGPFAILQAALYSMKEFGWPALATSAYHIGIIIGAIAGGVLGSRYFGEYGLAFGVLLGAFGEVVLLIPGMRRQRFSYMFILDLKHPALQRILKLYAPVAFSFLVSMGLVFLDQYLASRTPCVTSIAGQSNCKEANYAAMRFATTLVQFPAGLVAFALSFAVLPTLSAQARDGQMEGFKDILLLGIRLGLLLMIPAAAGLIVLQVPIVRLLFEHGNNNEANALLAGVALQNYAYQLPFLALDQLLIAAFYARKNTITPVVVGIVSILGYLAVALPFWQTIGMPALAFANTVQNSLHAVILLVLLRFAIGPMHLSKIALVLLKILLVTAAMVAAVLGLQFLLGQVPLFSLDTLIGKLLTVTIVGAAAVVVYLGGATLLKIEEIKLLKGVILAKFGRRG